MYNVHVHVCVVVTQYGSFLENNNQQPQAIHYKGGMYVHVTDKEKHCGRRNLIHGQIFMP